jgi:hypothetical protein
MKIKGLIKNYWEYDYTVIIRHVGKLTYYASTCDKKEAHRLAQEREGGEVVLTSEI